MKTQDFFKIGKNNIGWIGSNFQDNFMDMEFEIPKKLELKTKQLKKWMSGNEILAEFKTKESTLGEVAYALKNSDQLLKNGYSNIFFVRDKSNVLWAMSFYWNSDYGYWRVDAYSVESPLGWDPGGQFLSSDWVFKTPDTSDLKLGDSELVKVIEIEWKNKRYKLIEE